ncbi:YDG domain-containing protein, partial [Alphaproteobacteria bacterium]|nr:YDG domain-containing protein [Alphaproteobacteria bacterium]
SGTNTYTGSTTINVGAIRISADSGLGAAPGSTTVDHLTINGGTLTSTADFTLSSNRGVALGSSHGTFRVNGSTTLTVAGIVSGSNNLIKSASGTLILSGVNTYSGTTTINGGTLNISGQLGSGSYSNTISNSGTFEISSSSNQTISGVISNSGNLVKSGSGTLTLSATNTFTGTTTINGGVVSISAEAGLGATPGSATEGHLTLNGGTLRFTTSFTLNSNRGIALGASHGTIDLDTGLTLTYGGIIAGSNNLTKSGSGTLLLSGVNTYSGQTIISVGTFQVTGTLADTNDVSVSSGATYDVDATDTIQSLSGAGNIELASGITLTTGDGGNDTSSGVLSGAGNIVKAGSGTLTLSGANTYTGTTTISGGTISIAADNGLGAVPGSATAGHLTLNGGALQSTADFTLNSNRGIALGVSNGTINVDGSTTLTFGGIIAGSGSFTKIGSGMLVLTSQLSTYSGGTINNAGTLKLAATSVGSLGSATSGPIGTGSLTNNAILDVDGNLIHNTKNNNGSIINKPVPVTNFSSSSLAVIYGDTVTNNFTTDTNGSKTFSSSNTSSATINSSNGTVALVKVGNTTMSVALAETNEYASATDSYTLAISPKTITASASASNKVYDGTSTATTALTFSGLVGSETLGQTVASTFSDKNVGTGKTVTVNSITLADGTNGGLAVNYSISSGQTATANITAKPLTVSGITTSNKTYDATTSASLNTVSVSYGGLVSGDILTGTYSGVFNNANVGTGKTVTITSSYSGADVNNYTITDQASTTADVIAKVLTATASASNKVYDGSSTATSTLSLSGFIGSQTVTSTNSSTFNNKNVGNGKTVTVNSITLADGSNGGLASNYSISTGQTTTANVTAKALTASASSSNKVYDGLTTATTTLTFSGLVGSETLGQTVGSTFSDKNVATGKTVTVNSITLADGSNGGLASNYSISTGQTTTANITVKSLTVSGITASNKTYDSTTSATLGTGSVSYGGLVSGDDFVGSYSGVFADANVGTGKTVNITSSYSGADVNNYSVTDQPTTTANITAKALTATASASNKVYNSSSAATVTLSLSGFIGSETVTSTNSSTFNDKNVGTGKTVTVNSITLADGSNGGLAANYSISTGQTTTANITAKSLTVSGITTSNKTYDGNSVATLNTSSVAYSGLVGGDTFNGTYTGAFSDKNVGTGKTVTITPSYTGADVSNYSITNHADLTANITLRSLTVSGVAALDKTYDGSVTAIIDSSSAVYSGFVSGDDFAASYSGVFANANVGSGKTVTITSSYAGADVSNYNITNQSSTTADINKKVLLLSTFSASDKAYDGNNTPTISSAVSGFVGSETVSHSMTATFDNKNVGSNKVVTANSITLADGTNGGLASNYSISTGQTTTANITAKTLTATASASNKVYDGLTTATTTLTFSGLIGSETLGQTVASTFSDKNVGTGKTVTVNSIALADGTNGGLAGNYSISPGQTTIANITAKALTVSGITASNKTYDASTSATLDSSSLSYSGLVTGDIFTGSYSGVFANANVGTGKTINITSSYSGTDVNNYTVTDQSTTTANITAKVLTATASASNKTYDGGTIATTILTFTGLIGSETLGQTVGSTFDNKNVGSNKTVTVNSITLADGTNGGLAANYSINAGQTTTANVTTKSLSVSGITASNKTYDGSTNVTLDASSVAYSGLVSGDTFNGTYTGAFSDKNVGIGKTVTITSSYSGADVSNYSVTGQSTTAANITAKSLTVSGITASSKTYDGSTSTTLDSTSVTYTGLLSGDTFTGSYSGVFANDNVGTGKTVNITSSYSGADSGNYSVTDQSSTTADISTKALTATASASNKTYDGGTTATTTLILSGFIGSETLTSSTSSSFNNKNVGTGKAVTVNSITLADGTNGGLAANYSISAGQTTTANITAKSLTVSGITSSNKIYDGNTVATLDSSSVTYSGLVSGDSFAGSYSGLFSDKNIGTGKTVTISSSYSGSDVNNYTVTDQSSTTANITSRPLGVTGITVFGLSVNNKEYDGTVTAPLDTSSISYSGLVDGDDFTGIYSGVFANANVGNGKAVTITSSYSGADSGNYSVADQSTTTGNIVPKVLTATASASNKTYDGGTTASTTLTFSGLVGSETLGQTVGSTFDNKNVGSNKTVTVNSI